MFISFRFLYSVQLSFGSNTYGLTDEKGDRGAPETFEIEGLIE
jgi:hypothetical protein